MGNCQEHAKPVSFRVQKVGSGEPNNELHNSHKSDDYVADLGGGSVSKKTYKVPMTVQVVISSCKMTHFAAHLSLGFRV